jgi:sporulation protein YlmC with PRC-barrel domain
MLVLSLLVALSPLALAQQQRWEMPVSELRGMPITTPQGAPLGTIGGLLLDVRPRGVHYALLETPAGKHFAYPVSALRPAPEDALLLNARPKNLAIAPGYPGRTWPDPQFRDGQRYVRAMKVLGSPVEDRLGNGVGRVADVVLSLRSGMTERVLVDFDDAETLSLPAHSVRLRPGGGAIVAADSSRRS